MKHIVIDLEMNPVSRDFKEVRTKLTDEVIEFGAVCLSDDFEAEREFQCYVKPSYGQIKPRITELTGITEEMVAGKETFPAAFERFWAWVQEAGEETKIYSWSKSDLKQLRNECKTKLPHFDIKKMANMWVDLQKVFDDRLGLHNNLALKHALGAMDKKFEGTAHTALADAINTSAILVLMQDEEAFQQTMKPVLDLLKKEELSTTIGDLCPELMNFKEEG